MGAGAGALGEGRADAIAQQALRYAEEAEEGKSAHVSDDDVRSASSSPPPPQRLSHALRKFLRMRKAGVPVRACVKACELTYGSGGLVSRERESAFMAWCETQPSFSLAPNEIASLFPSAMATTAEAGSGGGSGKAADGGLEDADKGPEEDDYGGLSLHFRAGWSHRRTQILDDYEMLIGPARNLSAEKAAARLRRSPKFDPDDVEEFFRWHAGDRNLAAERRAGALVRRMAQGDNANLWLNIVARLRGEIDHEQVYAWRREGASIDTCERRLRAWGLRPENAADELVQGALEFFIDMVLPPMRAQEHREAQREAKRRAREREGKHDGDGGEAADFAAANLAATKVGGR